MLEDRDYMRQPSFEPRRQMTIAILVVNVVVFLIQSLAPENSELPGKYFALSAEGLRHGYVWQLLTFQFMHANMLHILLNSWGIYVFGRAVEDAIGAARWLQLYLASGVIGGLVQVGCSMLLPHIFGEAGVVGASAGLFGLISAFATLFPHQRLTLLLFFVLPITLTARVMVIVSAIIAVLGIILHSDNVAHAAHLGGMGAGILLVRLMMQGHWPKLATTPRRRTREYANVVAQYQHGYNTPPPLVTPEELPPTEFISKEVDPILDKISAHGIQSLTERERKILDAARKKMDRR